MLINSKYSDRDRKVDQDYQPNSNRSPEASASTPTCNLNYKGYIGCFPFKVCLALLAMEPKMG